MTEMADEVGNVFESYDVDAYGEPTMTAHTFSDFDGDGDVDPADFLTFNNCYNGSLNPPKPGCANPMAAITVSPTSSLQCGFFLDRTPSRTFDM